MWLCHAFSWSLKRSDISSTFMHFLATHVSSFAFFPHFLLGVAAFFILKLLFKGLYHCIRRLYHSLEHEFSARAKISSWGVKKILIFSCRKHSYAYILYTQIFGISVVLKFHKRWLGKKCLKQPGRDNEKKAEKHWFIAIFPSLWPWTSLGAYLFPSSG